jgi:DNA-directed RNA polymerase subunit K/omega
MAIQTVDLRKLNDVNDNVYEACLLIAARARQINSDRIAKKKENEILDDMDMYDETDIYDRELMKDIKFEREINPTVVAQGELYEGKVKPLYITEDVEEDVEEEEKPLD